MAVAIPIPPPTKPAPIGESTVLIGSSNYFTPGPKRSTSSFHEAMILAFVFMAL
jgi:hypothetical protein